MSTIPPNLVGPIIQAAAAQQSASRILESERGQQTSAADAGSKARDRKTESVDEAVSDTQVYAESEGSGSQGRAYSDTEEDNSAGDATDKPGVSRDQDGNLHIDLEA